MQPLSNATVVHLNLCLLGLLQRNAEHKTGAVAESAFSPVKPAVTTASARPASVAAAAAAPAQPPGGPGAASGGAHASAASTWSARQRATSQGSFSIAPSASNVSLASAAATPESRKPARALYAFKAQTPDQLSFEAGQLLTVITGGSQAPVSQDWIRAQTETGQIGLVPANFVSDLPANEVANPKLATALFAYKALAAGQISFEKDAVLAVLSRQTEAAGWVYGHVKTNAGGPRECGLIPENYLDFTNRADDAKAAAQASPTCARQHVLSLKTYNVTIWTAFRCTPSYL